MLAVVERLEAVRKLGVGADREKRIHRARYAAIAREIAILVPRDISRFDTPRRLATLVVFAREMEAVLTDAALAMFDKMLGAVFRRADRAHKDNVVDRAKTLDASARALLGMAKAMLAAKAKNEDQVAAVERALGWERLKTLVAEDGSGRRRYATRQSRRSRRALRERAAHVAGHARRFRLPIMEGERSAARRARRGARASRERREETSRRIRRRAFLRPVWRKLVKTDAGIDRRAYEVAVMMALRERLQSGDVWVEGSRAFRAFDDFLLPPRRVREPPQGRRIGPRRSPIVSRIGATRKPTLLETRLREVDALAAAGELPEASLTEEGLSISPIRKS